MSRPCCRLLFRWLVAWAAFGGIAWAAPPDEYEVKAAFLFNFAKFVDWPRPSGNLKLCLVGADPFEGALAAFDNRLIGERRFVSRRLALRSDAELLACDMLYIAGSEHERVASLLEAVRGAPVLTVGDGPGYGGEGMMINFYLDQGKVRFEVDPGAARRSGLKLSAKLIQLGRQVGN